MSDDAWDADDFDPDKGFEAVKVPGVSNDKWEGEDEEDAVKESWEDEDEEKVDLQTTVAPKKKKKTVKEKIAEKEEKKRLEHEARIKAMEAMTPEEKLAEKLRLQKLQEEGDLEIAKETFGMQQGLGKTGIDAMHPVSKDEFEEFEKALKDKLIQYEKSAFYVAFLENLFRDVTAGLEVDDVKKLASTLNAISNEKTKAEKALKGKKKKKASSLNVGRGDIMDSIGAADDYGDEFDDFI
ncbi:eukaryotic translation initiation factor 3 subunit J [Lingula anatina]|uniref:Eukaryotic translation initiation factor 3 subunit J n=1 Tax=Lingula anatina TaxID=7574 RepID=A0A1S3J767_LINAN|nr:eukaryotic translation initiation factor 3 subunit J [Lingula anatina]|eukprot:XP_013405684.1 eukaryotic translation initiation factor 3 subunit J [Lingula anatina]